MAQQNFIQFAAKSVFIMLLILFGLLAGCGGEKSSSQDQAGTPREIDEGIEYKLIKPPVPTDTGDKIEVVELFWYMCPHCYRAEPEVQAWKKTIPENVVFKRVPAIFSEQWVFHARVFYTAKALGVLEKIHTPLFDSIHKHKQKIVSAKAMAQFFNKHAGTDVALFESTFNSFGVDANVRGALDLSKRYQAGGVPSMIVNGKYITDGPMNDGHPGMMETVNFLIKKEMSKK